MNVIFMGTPDFSVSILDEIIKNGHNVLAVVTQNDKPKGRGGEISFPAVKEKALEYGIKVLQPEKIKKNQEFLEELKSMNPDIIIVAAYGKILPEEILTLSKYGCVNVHASILPKYRGAAPIQWSIIDGEEYTGVTTMMMDVGLDTGDILDIKKVKIEEDETGGSLFDKLSIEGSKLIIETMKKFEDGTIKRIKQDESLSTYAKILTKETGRIDFNNTAVSIERLIRGLNPWPSAFTSFRGKTLKIWKAYVKEDVEISGKVGEIREVGKDYIGIATRDGLLCITELQLEGKKRMDTKSFLQGVKVEVSEILG